MFALLCRGGYSTSLHRCSRIADLEPHEYMRALGKVIRILPDGRPVIIVKVA